MAAKKRKRKVKRSGGTNPDGKGVYRARGVGRWPSKMQRRNKRKRARTARTKSEIAAMLAARGKRQGPIIIILAPKQGVRQ